MGKDFQAQTTIHSFMPLLTRRTLPFPLGIQSRFFVVEASNSVLLAPFAVRLSSLSKEDIEAGIWDSVMRDSLKPLGSLVHAHRCSTFWSRNPSTVFSSVSGLHFLITTQTSPNSHTPRRLSPGQGRYIRALGIDTIRCEINTEIRVITLVFGGPAGIFNAPNF